MTNSNDIITKKELCVHTHLNKTTIEKLMKLNVIPFLKLGTARQARVLFSLETVQNALDVAFGRHIFNKEPLSL